MTKLFSWLASKKDSINRFAIPFFISYFLLIAAPYCFVLVPAINTFFTAIVSKLAFRLFTLLYFVIYAFLVGVANCSRIKWTWVIALAVLLITFLIAWIVTPRTFTYSTIDRDQAVTIVTIYVGDMDLLISFGLFFAECLMFILSISFLPAVVTRKVVIWSLGAVAAFGATVCLISYIKDFTFYFSFVTHGNPGTNGISSIFHHKNEFGIFIFLGCFSSLFLSCYLPSKKAIPFIVGSIQFIVTSLAIKCLTAEIPCLFLALVFIFYLFGALKKKSNALFLVLTCSFIGLIGVFLTCVFVPGIRDRFSAFGGIYNSIMSFSDEIASRTDVWNFIPSIMKGPALFLGKTDAIANQELLCYLSATGILRVIDYHDAFISFLTSHGLIGLAVYLAIHADIVTKILPIRTKNPRIFFVLIVLFLSAVFFSMPETYTLFINMSASVFPINLLFLVFLPYLSSEKGTEHSPFASQKDTVTEPGCIKA